MENDLERNYLHTKIGRERKREGLKSYEKRGKLAVTDIDIKTCCNNNI